VEEAEAAQAEAAQAAQAAQAEAEAAQAEAEAAQAEAEAAQAEAEAAQAEAQADVPPLEALSPTAGGAQSPDLLDTSNRSPLVVGNPSNVAYYTSLLAAGAPKYTGKFLGDEIRSAIKTPQDIGIAGVLRKLLLQEGFPPEPKESNIMSWFYAGIANLKKPELKSLAKLIEVTEPEKYPQSNPRTRDVSLGAVYNGEETRKTLTISIMNKVLNAPFDKDTKEKVAEASSWKKPPFNTLDFVKVSETDGIPLYRFTLDVGRGEAKVPVGECYAESLHSNMTHTDEELSITYKVPEYVATYDSEEGEALRPPERLKITDAGGKAINAGDLFSYTIEGITRTFMLFEARLEGQALLNTDFQQTFIQETTTDEDLRAQGLEMQSIYQMRARTNMEKILFTCNSDHQLEKCHLLVE
jgi:hypothetical protein